MSSFQLYRQLHRFIQDINLSKYDDTERDLDTTIKIKMGNNCHCKMFTIMAGY